MPGDWTWEKVYEKCGFTEPVAFARAAREQNLQRKDLRPEHLDAEKDRNSGRTTLAMSRAVAAALNTGQPVLITADTSRRELHAVTAARAMFRICAPSSPELIHSKGRRWKDFPKGTQTFNDHDLVLAPPRKMWQCDPGPYDAIRWDGSEEARQQICALNVPGSNHYYPPGCIGDWVVIPPKGEPFVLLDYVF